jgi:hypothetical protein
MKQCSSGNAAGNVPTTDHYLSRTFGHDVRSRITDDDDHRVRGHQKRAQQVPRTPVSSRHYSNSCQPLTNNRGTWASSHAHARGPNVVYRQQLKNTGDGIVRGARPVSLIVINDNRIVRCVCQRSAVRGDMHRIPLIGKVDDMATAMRDPNQLGKR